MSPLLRKEIRLLLPNSVLIVCLLGLIMLVPRHFNQGVSFALVGFPLLMICPILVALMVLGTFGREISPEMIGQFLSQPISRVRIWCLKTSLLTLLIALLWWCWWQVYQHHFIVNHTPAEMAEMQIRTPLLAAALLSGGLWAILVTRSLVTAFWLVVLAPAFPLMISEGFLEGRVKNPEAIVITLLALYTIAGSVLAFRLFLRLQHTGEEVEIVTITDVSKTWFTLPSWATERRFQKPWLALLRKELRMYQGFLVFVFWNALVHLGMIALRSSIHLDRITAWDMACNYYWVSWLILPVMIGCHLVAQERRFGVWESQLTLPYQRSKQVALKGLLAGILAIIFGAIVPLAIEQNRIFSELRFDPTTLLQERSQLLKEGGFSRLALLFAEGVQALPFHPEPLVKLTLISVGLLLLAIFASSLTRSVMHALSLAILGLLLGLTLSLALVMPPTSQVPSAFQGPLALVLISSMMAITVGWLIARNSCQVDVRPALWVRNGVVLILALLGSAALTSMIYYRSWERLTPVEPSHGPSRLLVEDRIHIDTQWRALSFTSSNGRSWSADRAVPESPLWERYFGDYRQSPLAKPIVPVEGSNWTQVVHAALDVVGIQKDGSLWVSDQPQLQHTSARPRQSQAGEPVRMVRFGNDHDWKQVVPYRSGVLLLASNGTLWAWQKPKIGAVREYQGLSHEVPSEVSPHKDWTDLRRTSEGWGYGFQLQRTDGSAWIHPHENPPMADRIKLDETTELGRAFYLDSGRALRHATARSQSDPTGPFKVGINRDGQLEIVAAWQSSHDARRWSYKPTNIPLGKKGERPWIDVASAGDRGTLITLRADGTLWKWRFPTSPIQAPETAKATRLGIHSDWVALAPFENEIITLAADGSLWAWQFESPYGTGGLRLLAPSSKPRQLGSILAAAAR